MGTSKGATVNSISISKQLNARDRRAAVTGDALPGYFAKLQGTELVSWGDVDADSIRAAVANLTHHGHALTLGRTSDGGAYSMTCLTGAAPIKLYASSASACEDLLTRIAGVEFDK